MYKKQDEFSLKELDRMYDEAMEGNEAKEIERGKSDEAENTVGDE